MRNVLYYDYLTQCFRFKSDGRVKETKEQNFERKLLEDKYQMISDMGLSKEDEWKRKKDILIQLTNQK